MGCTMPETQSDTWDTPNGELKRTVDENGTMRFFLDGNPIKNERALDLIDRVENDDNEPENESTNDSNNTESTRESEPVEENSKFDNVRVLKGKDYKFRSENDDEEIRQIHFVKVKLYENFIVGTTENGINLKIDHIQIIEGEV